MNVAEQTNACSKLTKMDCNKAGGGCCASNSDGTGTVSAAKARSSEEMCGYCFTGEPAAAISTTQGRGRRNRTLIDEKAILEGSYTIHYI